MVTKHYDRLPAEAIKGRAKALSMDALVKTLRTRINQFARLICLAEWFTCNAM